jgi:hypothetical protein
MHLLAGIGILALLGAIFAIGFGVGFGALAALCLTLALLRYDRRVGRRNR